MKDGTEAKTPTLTRVHKVLIGVVTFGAVVIASIGFAGSYSAVHALAVKKGFGDFALVFPIGIDAGIVVLLGLDLLLTWIRIPFPLLRQTAWLLTAATIAFNAASAWPDPLGVGMHGVIPILFVVAVEAARHAVGRIADITADKHMEGVRLTRWMLSPMPTFLLWRRMKLWELRSYEQVVKMEQERLVYQARLRQRFGRAWRRKAPVEAMMPLRLARYGVPLRETAPAGLEAAGITVPAELERLDRDEVREELPATTPELESEAGTVDVDQHHGQDEVDVPELAAGHPEPTVAPIPPQPAPEPYEAYGHGVDVEYSGGYDPYGQLQVNGQMAAAGGPLAARGDGRPAMVQARIDRADWLQKDLEPIADETVHSPIDDSPEPVPAPEPVPVPEVINEAMDEGAEPEPQLTGKELLEHLYLQLPPEQRYPNTSASALAREWHADAGFTVNSARKYLGDIIRKHD
ncbi:Protein of unknown function [Streptomyces sp. Ag82_O1-12]|uniref:DUF2637 domain-containing protein n=1 Tax=unclassified Streptomyces TaxID=2593676 RepID=UPI000BDB99AD|nr:MULTISPECIES: DUF2637 domain-containing protein [unclassified Streptomyces]SMQ21978.1 Protein of unknown function [Streptomyces sp. Ag82_O1-12]SOE08255.1 Protein of unknown function [Streptomyces sp. Ag82_G6-1]